MPSLSQLTLRSPHRGISLMEVLMSIGVLSIGLLGVVSLIPFAQHKAMQGTLEDRKALAGRRAFREFNVREMGDMTRWIASGTGGYALASSLGNRPSFCLDPRLAAAQVFPLGGTPATGVMRRVTLESFRGSGLPMGPDQAEHVFVFEDDLVYDRPAETVLPPEQIVLGADATSDGLVNHKDDIPWKRQADGAFSWMATLVPEPVLASDVYHLSVVVMFKRVLDPIVPGENVVGVNGFYGAGLSGGDLELVAANPNATVHLQELKPGDWLVLHQQRPMVTNADVANLASTPVSYFRWYRVVSGAEPVDGQTTREITLQGPDWDANLPTTAILVRDVVAVYEKTVRLTR